MILTIGRVRFTFTRNTAIALAITVPTLLAAYAFAMAIITNPGVN